MKYRVLIVEDEEILRDVLQTYLGKLYKTDTASSGEEALEKMSQHHYHIVITDINMPGITGIELMKTIRKGNPWIQVIIITGYPTLNTAIDCIDTGASFYLVKPFRMDEIKKTTAICIRRLERWERIVFDIVNSHHRTHKYGIPATPEASDLIPQASQA